MWNQFGSQQQQASPYHQQQPKNQPYGMAPQPLGPSPNYAQQSGGTTPQGGYSQMSPMMPFGPSQGLESSGGRYPYPPQGHPALPQNLPPMSDYGMPEADMMPPGRGLMNQHQQQFSGHPQLRPMMGGSPFTR